MAPTGVGFHAGPIVAAAADVLADELMSRRIELRLGALPELVADARQLYQATVALLRLVARAAPPGSLLTIGALRRGSEWQFRLAIHQPGGSAVSRAAPSLTDGAGGLELLTAERAVEAHGGRLWFTGSGVHPGSAVWFTIPDPPADRP